MSRPHLVSAALQLLAGVGLGIAGFGSLPAVALADGFEMVGHLGGLPSTLTVQGRQAYLGTGPELAIVDVSGAQPATRIGYVVFQDMVQDIALTTDGAYAAVAAGTTGLRLVDITRPEAPHDVTSVATPRRAMGVAIAGHYAYVADDTGLQIVDIAEPARATVTGALEISGYADRVAAYGNYVYVARTVGSGEVHQASLLVVDVSDPGRPVAMGSVEVEGYAARVDVAVAPDGNHALLAAGMAGLRVIDVSDPSAPAETGAWVPEHPRPNVWRVQMIGDRAWLADSTAGVYALDVSNPAAPALVASYTEAGGAVDVAGDGGSVHVLTWDTLVVLDAAGTGTPVPVASQPLLGNAERLAINGGAAYVAGGHTVWMVDIADPRLLRKHAGLPPAAPAVVSSSAFEREVQAVALGRSLWGDSLLVASGDCAGGPCRGELTVLDATHATRPGVLGRWQPDAGYAVGVATTGEFAYLAARDAGLWVLDISSSSTPRHVATVPAPGFAMDVAVQGEFAYLAARGGGLYVVQGVPLHPAVAGVLAPPDETWSVAAADGYVYVGDRTFGLNVVDVSVPVAPGEMGFVDPIGSGGIEDMVVAGETLYAAAGFDGLLTVDITDPSMPRESGGYDTPGTTSGVAVVGDLVYVADGLGGLYVLRQK